MKNNKIYRITIEESQENSTFKKLEQSNTNYAVIADGKNITIMAHEISSEDLIELVLNIIDAIYVFISKKVDLDYKEYVELLKKLLLKKLLLKHKEQNSIEIDIIELINQILNNDKD